MDNSSKSFIKKDKSYINKRLLLQNKDNLLIFLKKIEKISDIPIVVYPVIRVSHACKERLIQIEESI